MGIKLVNAQFSQRQETEADNYSYDLLKKTRHFNGRSGHGFEKLAKMDKGQNSIFDSHPPTAERAENIPQPDRGR